MPKQDCNEELADSFRKFLSALSAYEAVSASYNDLVDALIDAIDDPEQLREIALGLERNEKDGTACPTAE